MTNMLLEDTKKILESITGYKKPNASDLKHLTNIRKPNTYYFKDDGETPNNCKYPVIFYHTPVKLTSEFDPAAVFETLFALNDWKSSWRDSIYNFLHLHTHRHEVLGIARGHARVRLGGKYGRTIEVKAGDVIILPAGTGHYRISKSSDLLVVGAYPVNSGKYDEPSPEEIHHSIAIRNISKVRIPKKDPVYGIKRGLLKIWK